jgi:hypothetical protein
MPPIPRSASRRTRGAAPSHARHAFMRRCNGAVQARGCLALRPRVARAILRRAVRFGLEPRDDPRPRAFEGVGPSAPVPGRLLRSSVSRTNFSATPRFAEALQGALEVRITVREDMGGLACVRWPRRAARRTRRRVIAPHNPTRKTKTQDGRPLRRYRRRWHVERLFACAQLPRLREARLHGHPASAADVPVQVGVIPLFPGRGVVGCVLV